MAAAKKKNSATLNVASLKPSKTCSLEQFKAWLSGVEEMQEDGWVPNSTQWRRIRQKIDEVVENSRPFNAGAAGAPVVSDQPARIVQPSGPSAFSNVPSVNMTGAAPAPPPHISFVATTDMTRDGSGARIKTPNVDTSQQPYQSSLE